MPRKRSRYSSTPVHPNRYRPLQLTAMGALVAALIVELIVLAPRF